MKRAFAVVALAAIVAAVVACGGSSSTGSTGGSSLGSADRDKFVGTWTGHYGCPGMGVTIEDKMIIEAGSAALDLKIQIHVAAANPDTVNGTLTSATEVNVPEQSMGGGSGTAKLTLKGETLEFQATGLGITCGGTDYKKA
jgi:hypothetical protein